MIYAGNPHDTMARLKVGCKYQLMTPITAHRQRCARHTPPLLST